MGHNGCRVSATKSYCRQRRQRCRPRRGWVHEATVHEATGSIHKAAGRVHRSTGLCKISSRLRGRSPRRSDPCRLRGWCPRWSSLCSLRLRLGHHLQCVFVCVRARASVHDLGKRRGAKDGVRSTVATGVTWKKGLARGVSVVARGGAWDMARVGERGVRRIWRVVAKKVVRGRWRKR